MLQVAFCLHCTICCRQERQLAVAMSLFCTACEPPLQDKMETKREGGSGRPGHAPRYSIFTAARRRSAVHT